MRRGELLADSILDKQMRTKVLAVAIMAAFFGAPVQAASTEQGAPAYASTLRRAVIFENDTDSKLPLAERMERWKVPGLSVAVIDGCKIVDRSEEHTSELQSLMRISYAVFCLKKKKTKRY